MSLDSTSSLPSRSRDSRPWEPLTLNSLGTSAVENVKGNVRRQLEGLGWKDCHITIDDNCVEFKQSPEGGNEIGDLRVSFHKVQCCRLTVVAEQAGITFRPYNVKRRMFFRREESELATLLEEEHLGLCPTLEGSVDICCQRTCFCFEFVNKQGGPQRVIDWLQPGMMLKGEVFRKFVRRSRVVDYPLRILGFVLTVVGVWFMTKPVMENLAIAKKIKGDAGNVVTGSLLGIALHLVVVGFAWIFYKRYTSIGLIAAGSVLLYCASME